MANIVFGIIENADGRFVEPFIDSLRASGYEDEVVLFGHNVSTEARKLLFYHKVRLKQYVAIRNQKKIGGLEEWFIKCFDGYDRFFLSKIFPFRDAVIKLFWDCKAVRYYFYDDFLRKSPIKYEKILICDVRDTIFQRYPFSKELESDIYCFEEYPGIKICEEDWNKKWIVQLFGEDILMELGNKSILCSGIILGTHEGMLRFLFAMKSFLWKYCWPIGYDQGILNFLIYKGCLANAQIVPFGEGPVMHIGIAPRNKIPIGKNGDVLCADGSVCPIVHQYDRHPDIQPNVSKR